MHAIRQVLRPAISHCVEPTVNFLKVKSVLYMLLSHAVALLNAVQVLVKLRTSMKQHH